MIKCIKHTEATLEQKLVFGEINGNPVQTELIKADLDPADVIIYDDYGSLFTTNCFSDIANAPETLDMDCFTSVVVVEGTDDLDYATMVQGDKDKVDAFISMAERLNQLPPIV
jgi:hypothetical protein